MRTCIHKYVGMVDMDWETRLGIGSSENLSGAVSVGSTANYPDVCNLVHWPHTE